MTSLCSEIVNTIMFKDIIKRVAVRNRSVSTSDTVNISRFTSLEVILECLW